MQSQEKYQKDLCKYKEADSKIFMERESDSQTSFEKEQSWRTPWSEDLI